FHMWTPDVYEGAPTPVTAFFASAPKIAAMAIFVRAPIAAFPEITPQWQQIVVFVSIASMALGSFAAIGQRNIQRLMPYSSIGHMGFALVGLAAGTPEGVQGVIIYMAIYLAMTLGTFAAILSMRAHGVLVENISDLAGLARTKPAMALVFAIMMFSLAGIPPLGGFFRESFRLPRRYQGGPLHRVGDGRAGGRGRGLLLPRDRQGDVFRRAGRAVRADARLVETRPRGQRRRGAAARDPARSADRG